MSVQSTKMIVLIHWQTVLTHHQDLLLALVLLVILVQDMGIIHVQVMNPLTKFRFAISIFFNLKSHYEHIKICNQAETK